MNTRVYWRERFHNLSPDRAPVETRQLDAFLIANNASKCFVKAQGGWYKVTKESTLIFVIRALYLMSLEEWLRIALDDSYHRQ